MSFDCSRFSFQPWNDFLGVVMQQGRVQLDSDWNDLVAQLTRRIQTGTRDTFGKAVVPRETPDGFLITFTNNPKDLMIGAGRIYVDGILAENHGAPPKNDISSLKWDTRLAELVSDDPISFFEQPYLPFNSIKASINMETVTRRTFRGEAIDPSAVFNPPELDEGPYLVYVDVWQREITSLQKPELIEKAVGVDTTGRLQIVWQVKILKDIGDATCTSNDEDVPGWAELVRPSGARLSTSTGAVPVEPNPCFVPPSSGYQGLENQLYRVEIHNGGERGAATFKWARDNATIASRVTQIPTLTQLVVEHVKRDDVLGFHDGDWIEILDDRHELHGQPGILRRIKGDGIDQNSHTLTLETALPNSLFPVNADGTPVGGWSPRVRRWDQFGLVRHEDGTISHDLNFDSDPKGIPIPPVGTKLILENGILVDFTLEDGLEFKTGDYWVFTARTVDGKIDILDKSPPRGIHHHYARLAVVTPRSIVTDCRILYPPIIEGASCDCTVCVHVDAHNSGKATIQQAIDTVRKRGGGTICLETGIYRINRESLQINKVNSIRLRGQGPNTLLLGGGVGSIFEISDSIGVSIQNLSVINSTLRSHRAEGGRGNSAAVIVVNNTVDFSLDHVNAFCIALDQSNNAALDLSGYIMGATVRNCALVAPEGIAHAQDERSQHSLLTTALTITDCFLFCKNSGISFGQWTFHYGNLLIANNLLFGCNSIGISLTGGALPGSSVVLEKNVLNVSGTGIQCGLDGMRVIDNEITAIDHPSSGDGIVIDGGIDPIVDKLQIFGNRIHDIRGHGIAIRQAVGHGMINSNIIERAMGSGLKIEKAGSADYLSIENNHFLEVGPNDNSNTDVDVYAAVWLYRVKSADFIGNVMNGIARNSNRIIAESMGLLTIVCKELRVSGNRLQNIGSRNSLQSIGIKCASPFQYLAVHDNTILGADNIEAISGKWSALKVGFGLNPDKKQIINIGDLYLLASFENNQYVLISESVITKFGQETGSTGIHRNRFMMKGQHTDELISIANVATCLFTENLCEVNSSRFAFVGIQGEQINASNNRLIGRIETETPTLSIKARNIIVLGNLSTGKILVDGNPLEPRWADLNHT